MILTDDQAKAAQEVAKATSKALDVASGAGTVLVNGTVGKIAAATLGLIGGDWVQEQQKRNLARLEAKTARILDGIAQDRLNAPSPSVVKPLLEAAADESREELQDMWAALLANAMVDGGKQVRRDYFEAVRQMEPVDAAVLDLVARRLNPHSDDKQAADADVEFIERECRRLGISDDDRSIATANLAKLDCVIERKGGVGLSYPQPRAYPPSLTPFGRGLLRACKAP